jgi:hypothetical protein
MKVTGMTTALAEASVQNEMAYVADIVELIVPGAAQGLNVLNADRVARC